MAASYLRRRDVRAIELVHQSSSPVVPSGDRTAFEHMLEAIDGAHVDGARMTADALAFVSLFARILSRFPHAQFPSINKRSIVPATWISVKEPNVEFEYVFGDYHFADAVPGGDNHSRRNDPGPDSSVSSSSSSSTASSHPQQ